MRISSIENWFRCWSCILIVCWFVVFEVSHIGNSLSAYIWRGELFVYTQRGSDDGAVSRFRLNMQSVCVRLSNQLYHFWNSKVFLVIVSKLRYFGFLWILSSLWIAIAWITILVLVCIDFVADIRDTWRLIWFVYLMQAADEKVDSSMTVEGCCSNFLCEASESVLITILVVYIVAKLMFKILKRKQNSILALHWIYLFNYIGKNIHKAICIFCNNAFCCKNLMIICKIIKLTYVYEWRWTLVSKYYYYH